MPYIAALSMKRRNKTYSIFQLGSALVMILALLWLTVSAPFVQASQQALAEHVATSSDNALPVSDNDEENSNPFGNNTEEKAPTSSSSFSEEYLHDNHKSDYLFSIISQYRKCENAGTYVAFHGELLVPPPNVA
ncbi:hypothetical protein CAP36_06955 [Chitinophagaceae bacterium IBVUCB2]|nr:hypothetical protein CAP36_06955 [Chitinophagaceae bacterium IBVUCB2]